MNDKLDKSPCAELVPAALALPWHEMDSPPAGDPVPELPDQEEPAETDDNDEEEPEPSEAKSGTKGKGAAIGAVIGAAIGVGVAVVGAPVAIWVAGFTGAGIAPGSIAAKMMSASAIANGGGVAAGSPVARLQSAGAVGLPVSVKAGLGATLGSVGAAFGGSFFSNNKSK